MIPPIDLSQLPAPVQKMAAPDAPERMQQMAAKGVVMGAKPGDVVALLVLLSQRDDRPEVAKTAAATLGALPDAVLWGALAAALQPGAADALVRAYAKRIDVLEKILARGDVPAESVAELAKHGDEAVTELIATNEDRLLKHPSIIECLYMNRHTRMSTADRLIDLASRNGVHLSGIPAFREAAMALEGELIPEAGEPTPDDELFVETAALASALESPEEEDTHHEDPEGQEVLKDKFAPLYQRIAQMTPSQKIRRAMLGTKEERMLLVRDSNRVVAAAVVRSPLMREDEAAMVSRNRNLPEEVLRIIGTTPEWLRSYSVKKNLVENPKTPTMIAQRLVPHLREAELRALAKSKNVTGPVKDAARRQLERRK